jgi:predicted lipid-binding transport protein (Tim44 family)
MASLLGRALQILLIVVLARLSFRFFQRRQKPALAGGERSAYAPAAPPPSGNTAGSAMGGGGAMPWSGVRREPLTLASMDFDTFERLLGAVQTAYGEGDRAALRQVTTPEVAGYLEEELAANDTRGVVNHVREPKLLQGDLAEAWREDGSDYATVAMRFSTVDYTAEQASGRVIEGNAEQSSEATEVWTFTRPRGGKWVLADIQQA